MGKFEVNTTINKDYSPETVRLLVQSMLFGKDRDTLKEKILKSVEEVRGIISEIYTEGFEVTYANIRYSESAFKPEKKGFFKNITVEDKIANFIIVIDLDLLKGVEQEKLEDLVGKLVMIDSVGSINYSTDLKDRELKSDEIKKELCEKCRKEAELITTSLGSEVLGIDSIVYHSSGLLIKNSNNSRDSVDYCDYEDDCCFEGGDFSTLRSIPEKELSVEEEWERKKRALKELGKGIVKGIMENKITISDNITVAFNVK